MNSEDAKHDLPNNLSYEEVYVRGTFGKFMKFLFYGFNIFMILWMGSYWYGLTNMTCKEAYPTDFALQAMCASNNDSFRTGSQVGGLIGTLFIAIFWLVGAVILGILTRMTAKKKLVASIK
jgi:hypothetical protein